ncbi:MAG: hypothetical protein QG639_478 [Patescibacteria group bacterium]|nr:hypothetical protein [Patescibacteria group bacterium]
MKSTLTVVINTKNSEKTLARTLQSVQELKNIVIVDMKSRDKTVTIAKKHTDKVYSFDDVGYVEPARNFAIEKANTDWVLVVDADEEISANLLQKIQELITHKSDIVCYFIPRKNIIFGKWIEKTGWWPDFQPRLFKKECVTWQDEVHSVPQINGSVEYLPVDPEAAIIHHNYESVSDYIQRLDRYTTITAEGQKSTKEFTTAGLIDSFSQELSRRLFYEKGVEEGLHGVGLSFLQSMYQVVTYLKTWEVSSQREATSPTSVSMAALEALRQDLSYWIADYKVKHTSFAQGLAWRIRRKLKI